ncbi:kinesin-domain-containing protein [Atractiella rhizophila]|nr:kinesin-domain-containing protein [Atractiella rhizophila]
MPRQQLRPVSPSEFEPPKPVYDPNDFFSRPILSGGYTPPSSPPKSPSKPRSPSKTSSPSKNLKSSTAISPEIVSKVTGTPERVRFMPSRKREEDGDGSILRRSKLSPKGKKGAVSKSGSKDELADMLLGLSIKTDNDVENTNAVFPLTAANLSFIDSVSSPTSFSIPISTTPQSSPTPFSPPPPLSQHLSTNSTLARPAIRASKLSSIPIPQTPQMKQQSSQPSSIRATVTPAAVRRKKIGLPGAEGADKPSKPLFRSGLKQAELLCTPSTPMLSRSTANPPPTFSAKDLGPTLAEEWDNEDDVELESEQRSNDRDNVHVCVRVKNIEEPGVWDIDERRGKLFDEDTGAEYCFDSVVTGSSNKAVYNKAARDIIVDCANGYDALIFAYGQTASGKTFTLAGDRQNGNPGIIPRAVSEIFAFIRANPQREFLLRASYLEIYNEQLRDLLAPDTVGQLRVRQDAQKRFFVSPLREELVTSEQAVFHLLQRGEMVRHVGETDFNARSSRSHTVFQLTIESRDALEDFPRQRKGRPSIGTAVRISKLSLVDLAGSEKATGQADRRLEGGFINRSLLTLEKVIGALTEKSSAHVPFRDSKLTQILHSSLSGEARVAVICTLNPSIRSREETRSTLRFACRIKKIVLNAEQHEVLDDKALITKYKATIQELQDKLAAKKAQESPAKVDLRHQLQDQQDIEDIKSQISELQTLFITSQNVDSRRESIIPRPVSPIKTTSRSSQFETDDENDVAALHEQIQRLREKNGELEDTVSFQHRQIADLEFSLASRSPLPVNATDDDKVARIAQLEQKLRELEVVLKNTDPELDLKRERRRVEKEWRERIGVLEQENKRLLKDLQLREEWEAEVKVQLDKERKRTKALEGFVMDKLQKTADRLTTRERKNRPRSSSVGGGAFVGLPMLHTETADVGRPSVGGASTVEFF